MKKLVAIPVLILILFTGITVNVASHFCSGTYIESKISLSGEPATCGMEHSHHEESGIDQYDHTCQDFISSYSFNSNYIPSAPAAYTHDFFQVAVITFNILAVNEPPSGASRFLKPPGVILPVKTDPEVICIFRI